MLGDGTTASRVNAVQVVGSGGAGFLNLAVIDTQAIRDRIVVSPQDVQRYYEDNQQQYSTPEQVRASHILLKTEGKDKEAVRKQAEDVLKQVKAGGGGPPVVMMSGHGTLEAAVKATRLTHRWLTTSRTPAPWAIFQKPVFQCSTGLRVPSGASPNHIRSLPRSNAVAWSTTPRASRRLTGITPMRRSNQPSTGTRNRVSLSPRACRISQPSTRTAAMVDEAVDEDCGSATIVLIFYVLAIVALAIWIIDRIWGA